MSRSGAWSIISDPSAYQAAHPVAHPGPDFEPDGSWYGMIAWRGPTPASGRVVRLDRRGGRTVVVSGLTWPTGLRFGHDGRLYIFHKGFAFGPPQPGEILRVEVADEGSDDDDMEHGDH